VAAMIVWQRWYLPVPIQPSRCRSRWRCAAALLRHSR
jgi:hypothetical protein